MKRAYQPLQKKNEKKNKQEKTLTIERETTCSLGIGEKARSMPVQRAECWLEA